MKKVRQNRGWNDAHRVLTLSVRRCLIGISQLITITMYTGITLFAHACKQVILNVSETGILTLTRILTACKRSHCCWEVESFCCVCNNLTISFVVPPNEDYRQHQHQDDDDDGKNHDQVQQHICERLKRRKSLTWSPVHIVYINTHIVYQSYCWWRKQQTVHEVSLSV